MGSIRKFAGANPRIAFLLLLLLVVLICMVASALIVTDREKINAVVRDCVTGLENCDTDAVMVHVAPDYSQEDMNTAGLRGYIEAGLARFGAPSIIVLTREFEVREREADCRLVLISSFPDSKDWRGTTIKSVWRVRMRKVGKEWLIAEVIPVEAANMKLGALRQLQRDYGY